MTPSIKLASNRTTVTTELPPIYFRTDSYARADVRVDYAILPQVAVRIGVRNLFDDDNVLTDGFPVRGRNFFASVLAVQGRSPGQGHSALHPGSAIP